MRGRDVASNQLDHACRHNQSEDEGAKGLAEGLGRMTGLQSLNLRYVVLVDVVCFAERVWCGEPVYALVWHAWCGC